MMNRRTRATLWRDSTWTCAKCEKEAVVADDGKPFIVACPTGIKPWVNMIGELDNGVHFSVGWNTKEHGPEVTEEAPFCKPCGLAVARKLLEQILKEK